jgi:hypothetical protein
MHFSRQTLLRLGSVTAVLTTGAVGGSALLGSAGAAPATGRQGVTRAALRRAVHVQAVVPVAGGGFHTLTLDRGFVQSVSGSELTLREGTRSATDRMLTLAVPANAVVRVNGRLATLSALRPGQHVAVLQGTPRAHVIAQDVP